jgi:hypothetical protein
MVDINLQHKFGGSILSIPRVRGKILNALQKVGNEALRRAQLTTATFDSYDVDWTMEFHFSGGDAVVTVSTDSELYGYLNDGTDLRWAVMNDPFVPKTSPRRSRAGSGVRTYNKNGEYTAIRGRRAMQAHNIAPRPGIQARHFDDQLEEELSDYIISEIENAIYEGTD